MTAGATWRSARGPRATLLWIVVSLVLAAGFMASPAASGEEAPGLLFWLATGALAALALAGIRRLAALDDHRAYAPLTAALFGVWVVYFWQLLTVALEVPRVLLPAPWLIVESLANNLPKLGNDFVQTGVALATYAYGRLTDAPKASHFGMDLLHPIPNVRPAPQQFVHFQDFGKDRKRLSR